MNLIEKKKIFETQCRIYESSTLQFVGVDGCDVYNTTIPFWYEGK